MLRRMALALVLAGMSIVLTTPAQARSSAAPLAASLAAQLAAATGQVPVFVHAATVAAARTAVTRAGLDLVTTWDRIGVAVARGGAAQVDAVRRLPGVTYVEGDVAIRPYLSTS